MASDLDLMTRICTGDTGALAELYDQYGGRVYALAITILGDEMRAQEVTQDTFMKIWHNARQYRHDEGRFVAWLLTITRRLAIDRLRYEYRRSGKSTSIDDENFPEIRDSVEEEGARWRELRHMLDELPTEQREVIILAYYHGMSQSEIALHLAIPIGTVKTRLRLGMEKLRLVYARVK